MEKSTNDLIFELESKIQILELENETLSEKAQENFLLNKVFEEINEFDQIDRLIFNTLESISVLLNIQFSGLFSRIGSDFVCESSYSLFNSTETVDVNLRIADSVFQKICKNGSCFISIEKADFSFEYPDAEFKPEYGIIVHISSKLFNDQYFVFLNDLNLQELKNRIPLFEKLIKIISTKLDRIYYQSELEKLNNELEQKITERTKELQLRNNELIAERLRAERSELQAKHILQTAMDGFWMVDLHGRFIDVNEVACKMLGYSRNEILKLHIHDIHANDSETQIKSRIEHIREVGEFRFESQHRKKDGQIIDVEVSVKYMEDRNLVVVFVKDISMRKKSELALKESETRFKALHNASFGGIAIHDKGRIIDCNKGLSEITGYANEELIGMDGLLLIAENSREQVMQNILNCYEKPYEAIGLRKNGQEYPIRLEGRMIPYHGKIVRVVEFRDITDTKNTENKLKQALIKATESDRLKSAFLANMSHEIRTPMNAIMGFAELLKEPGLSGNKQQEYIRIIERGGDRMLNIINDIIDISKIESGQMYATLEETNVLEQLEFVYQFHKHEVEQKGIKLLLKNKLSREEAILLTDQKKLYSILTNLLKNAIKYTSKGVIEIGCVKPKAGNQKDASGKSELLFFVKDTGIGIPKSRQEAIFERFIQADIVDRMARQGAGLGLSISKAYVEMLGGKIWLDSEPGKGSTFYFTLPGLSAEKLKA